MNRHDQCPRDDLFSIFYVIVDLICGRLPWTDASRAKERDLLAALKRKYANDIPSLIKWMKIEVSKLEGTYKDKEINSIDDLLEEGEIENEVEMVNFPGSACENLQKIFELLNKLEYEDVPDYDKIEEYLYLCIDERIDVSKEIISKVKEQDYDFKGFNWKGGTDNTKNSSNSSSSSKNTPMPKHNVEKVDLNEEIDLIKEPVKWQKQTQAKLRKLMKEKTERQQRKRNAKEAFSSAKNTLYENRSPMTSITPKTKDAETPATSPMERSVNLKVYNLGDIEAYDFTDKTTAELWCSLLNELSQTIPERKIMRETVDVFNEVFINWLFFLLVFFVHSLHHLITIT